MQHSISSYWITLLWLGLGSKWEEWWESLWHQAVWSSRSGAFTNTRKYSPLHTSSFISCPGATSFTRRRTRRKGHWQEVIIGWIPPEASVRAWHGKATAALVKNEHLWQLFLTNMQPITTKTTPQPHLGAMEHFTCVSLSLISEFRFLSNRFKHVVYHLSSPNASFYILRSLLFTATIHLGMIRNLPAFRRESGALDWTSYREMSTSDASIRDRSKNYKLSTFWVFLVTLLLPLPLGFCCLQSF